ncbi:MAG TPA: glycosyltransferase family 1 protein [Candidatus Bathyarchaeia archaeon]|nr:glycosyltransferase family 1 protein [Candidatus Bathyarchaeia archaeon]HUW24330.1 glycosyltransferase family 1 protein [Patescibacteria group bacterium]
MKVGIDISQITYEGTGVAAYTRSLVKALLRVDKNDDEFVLFGSSLRNRRPLIEFQKSLLAKNAKIKFSFLPPKLLEFLWNGVHIFPIENFIGEVDVFHSSDWLEPPSRKAKKVTTVHDLAVFKYPETFSPRGGHNIVENQKRKLHFVKQECDLIIAVSETTKQEAMEILKIPERRIKVVYEAADPIYYRRPTAEIAEVKRKYRLEEDYLLCVGTREPRKNLNRAIMAFAEIAVANKGLSLVIIGKYGWGDDSSKFNPSTKLRTRVQSSKLETRVKTLGFVEKEDLARLYSGASAFIYPSLYEGFGLPILEAMACGCPVITSDLGAMKEVAEEAALLVDPESIESIAGEISKVYRNKKLQEELKVKGLKRAGEFSWEKTALQTLELYRGLTN